MSKKSKTIYREKDVKGFAKKRGLNEEDTLKLWLVILEDTELNKMDDEDQRDGARIQLLKVRVAASQAGGSGKPVTTIVGVIIGLEKENLWDVENIKSVLNSYEKTGAIPVDDQNRPMLQIIKGDPRPTKYAKGTGTPYPWRVRKNRKMIFYGKPDGEAGDDVDNQMQGLTVGGEIKIDGEYQFVIDQIDEIPVGKKVRMNVEISDQYVNIGKHPIDENGYFDVIDDDIDFTVLFEEEALEKEFVPFDEIKDYAKNHQYTPFWTEATVSHIGVVGDYGTLPLDILENPSTSFDDGVGEKVTIWVTEDMPINYVQNSKVKLVLSGYVQKKDGEVGFNAGGIYPNKPVDPEEAKKALKKQAKDKGKKADKIDLFD